MKQNDDFERFQNFEFLPEEEKLKRINEAAEDSTLGNPMDEDDENISFLETCSEPTEYVEKRKLLKEIQEVLRYHDEHFKTQAATQRHKELRELFVVSTGYDGLILASDLTFEWQGYAYTKEVIEITNHLKVKGAKKMLQMKVKNYFKEVVKTVMRCRMQRIEKHHFTESLLYMDFNDKPWQALTDKYWANVGMKVGYVLQKYWNDPKRKWTKYQKTFEYWCTLMDWIVAYSSTPPELPTKRRMLAYRARKELWNRIPLFKDFEEEIERMKRWAKIYYPSRAIYFKEVFLLLENTSLF